MRHELLGHGQLSELLEPGFIMFPEGLGHATKGLEIVVLLQPVKVSALTLLTGCAAAHLASTRRVVAFKLRIIGHGRHDSLGLQDAA